MIKALLFFLRKISFIVRKELLASIKDPKTQTLLIVPVIVQSLLFGYAATYDLDRVPYAVLDQSRSIYSQRLLDMLDGFGIFRRTASLSGTDQISQAIDSDEAMLVISIPSDFANKIAGGREAAVQVIADGRNTTSAGVALGYFSSIADRFNSELHGRVSIAEADTVVWYNPNLISRWMFMPALLAMLSYIQIMLLSGLSVAREKEQGTFDQLLATPLTPMEILIGKAIPPLLIGTVQITFVLLVTLFWFRVPLAGSAISLYITLWIFLISCIGIGLSISALCSSMQQVMVYCFVLMLPMVLLSGMGTPVENMPEWLQYLTYANPVRFAVEAVRRIYLEGCGLADVAFNFVPMLAAAAVTLPAAAWLFRNKLY